MRCMLSTPATTRWPQRSPLTAALISFNFLIYWDFPPFKSRKQLAESLKSDLKTHSRTLGVVIVEELGHTRPAVGDPAPSHPGGVSVRLQGGRSVKCAGFDLNSFSAELQMFRC